ncbi:MAG: class I SAM-dependent methyltransferase family protein [Candidatus Micrarchaeia archaeon]
MPICAKVRKVDAERVRRELIGISALDFSYSPDRNGEYVYFPLKREIVGYKTVERELKKREIPAHSLHDYLRVFLNEEELSLVSKSFDIIGDIAVIEIDDALGEKKRIVADALMRMHRNIRVVARKTGPMGGIFRTRPLEIIAGENRTETLHRENGCVFKLDVASAYFSPRLSHERERIASLVGENEKVFALFAGVGPYPILIAKRQPKTKIYAIELNPHAFRYLEQNIRLNGVGANVIPLLGDVGEVLPKIKEKPDRVLMPLPKGAENFLGAVLRCAKEGTVIHFYTFSGSEELFEKPLSLVKSTATKMGWNVEILYKKIVRPYAPHVFQVVLDFRVFR